MQKIDYDATIREVMLGGSTSSACPGCAAVLTVEQPWCRACADRRADEWKRGEARRLVDEAWAVTVGTIPDWPWARFSNAEWTEGRNAACLSAARAWQPTGGMLLMGPTAQGKSSALVARLHELRRLAAGAVIDRGEATLTPVVWVTEQDLVAAVRVHPLGRGECPALREAKSARALIIDEMGPAGAKALMFDVINARYHRGLCTTVTTGRTYDQFMLTYGDAMVRRILTGGVLVDLHGGAS